MRTIEITAVTGMALALATSAASAQTRPAPPPRTTAAPTPEPTPGTREPAPQPAAPTPEEIARAKRHYMSGAELFDLKQYEEAVSEFKESYRLSRNPLLLYNIGFTVDQLGAADKAIFYYERFLAEAPGSAQNRDVATERAAALKRKRQGDDVFATGDGASAPDAERRRPAAPPRQYLPGEFKHSIIAEAPPGKPLDITAFAPEGAGWTLKLHYRRPGQSRFTGVEMRPRYNELVARIPATYTAGATLQYYVEAIDASGTVIARSGESSSPQLVVIEAGAAPHYYPDLSAPAEAQAEAAPERTVSSERGGWSDIHSSRFRYAKWGTTGGAVALLALSATFYFVASDAASALESDVFAAGDGCPGGPPCQTWSADQKSIEDRGSRFETMANVSLGLGALATIGAGVTWYWEHKQTKKERKKLDVAAIPVLGQEFVGGAAALRF